MRRLRQSENTMSGTGAIQNRTTSRSALVALVSAACLVFAATLWKSYDLAGAYYEGQLREDSGPKLELYVSSLNGVLDKYGILPEIISRDPAVRAALVDPGDRPTLMRAHAVLKELQKKIGALDVYVIDRSGLTIAASNYGLPKTFVGNNYSFRPYFRQAIEGGQGRYFAVGTTTGKRGYFMSSAVRLDGRIEGVVVVKVDLSRFESRWAPTEDQAVFVTDEHGVVILADNSDWLYRKIRNLTPAEVKRIDKERKYAGKKLTPLPVRMNDHVSVQATLPDHRFSLYLLTSKSRIARQVWNVMLTVCLTLLLLAVVTCALYLWQRHHLRELNYQTQLNSELEVRVGERTRELLETNVSLQREVVDRQAAEADLHRAQDELVQAGKLAALGTMSASISHELNQPLGAINSFAANARLLLKRDKPEDARRTLEHISDAAGRAARIVENLRAYVRRERKAPVEVDLSAALQKALTEAAPLLDNHNVDVNCQVSLNPLPVRGGPARIGQVFGNVITNAVLAMAASEPRVLNISSQVEDGLVHVLVTDSGPGFSNEALLRGKEPFFTTRAQAEGLGLGLAICENIMETLDGTIDINNSVSGGGCVRLTFKGVERRPL